MTDPAHTYWFTVAVGERHERYAADLVASANRHGIAIDVIRGGELPARLGSPKALKIEGILAAPDWAERIVFLDADTLLVDPWPLLEHDGAMRAAKRPQEWQSGVIAGPREAMRDLAEAWRAHWDLCFREDGTFWRDQIAFSPAYEQVAAEYGIGELPKVCNWLVKRWTLAGKGLPAVMHRAGDLDGRATQQWDRWREQVVGGFRRDPWGPCRHDGNCRCSGGRWSFAEPYQRVLDALPPRRVHEWGPGLQTLMAARVGAERIQCVEDDAAYAMDWRIEREDGQDRAVEIATRLADVDSPDYADPGDALLATADTIFVDGRRRADCLIACFEACRKDAVIGLHDAQRPRYRDALLRFPYVMYIDKGFAIASKSPRILRVPT